MDLGSIEKNTRHISDVQRVKAELETLLPAEKQYLIEIEKELVAIQWRECRRGFTMMFMALNRGNRYPQDSFVVKIDSRQYGNETYDTYMRIWRSKDHATYSVRPHVRRSGFIHDGGVMDTESFSDAFDYHHGTYHSHSARVVFDNDSGEVPDVRLDRVNGYLVNEMTVKEEAILLSALQGHVVPILEQTEDTLTMIAEAMLNNDLNPDIASKMRIERP